VIPGLRTVGRRALLVAAMLAALALPRVAAAQGDRYALIVEGASGEPQYAELHRAWLDELVKVLRDDFKYDATHLVVLAETAKTGEERSTAENVKAAMARFAKSVKAQDQLFVMFIGHGTADVAGAKFNLIGPDLAVADWAALLKPIPGRIAVVDATAGSFPFLAGLAGPNRVVITATSRNAQVFHSRFAEGFVAALKTNAADTDKNGRISLLEAFNYASRQVALHYEQAGTKQTEQAMLDDTGDGVGVQFGTTGTDGTAAGLMYLDALAMPKSNDPEVQQLLVRQQTLMQQVDDLRRRRASMPAEEFDREFEKVIIDLALVSRDVRKRTGGQEP